MEQSPGIARLDWPQAKVVHVVHRAQGGAFIPAAASADDLSLSNPASISLAFLGGCETFVESAGRASKRRIMPGGITLCGAEPIRWLGGSGAGAGEFIEITGREGFRRELAEEFGVPHRFDLDDEHGWTDPIVLAIAARFRSAARATISLSDLERDLLLRRLYTRILETCFGGRVPMRGHGGLDKIRLHRVLEFIQANLEEQLTIARLANVAALSPFHFVRAFRRSCALTPHAYVRGRRLERARELMASGLSPRSVARSIGYESLSHFRSAWGKHFGATYQHGRSNGEH